MKSITILSWKESTSSYVFTILCSWLKSCGG